MSPNGPLHWRRRPMKCQETWRVVPGVRTSQLLGMRQNIQQPDGQESQKYQNAETARAGRIARRCRCRLRTKPLSMTGVAEEFGLAFAPCLNCAIGMRRVGCATRTPKVFLLRFPARTKQQGNDNNDGNYCDKFWTKTIHICLTFRFTGDGALAPTSRETGG